MPTGNQKFEEAAKEALCWMLSSLGSTATGYTAWGLLTPGPFDEWAALGVAGLAGLAYANACQWDPDANPPPSGCQEVTKGTTLMAALRNTPSVVPHAYDAVEILDVTQDSGGYLSLCKYRAQSGEVFSVGSGWPYTDTSWFLDTSPTDVDCVKDGPGGPLPPPPPYDYVDPDDGCEITVIFEGWVVDPSGITAPVWKMEPTPVARASGGVIGGCNFQPVIYYGPGGPPGGGPPGGFPIPYVPGPPGEGGEPWWAGPVRGIVGGIAAELIRKLFEAKFASQVYRVVSVCEKDQDGEPVSEAREYVIPSAASFDAVVDRLDGIAYVLQGLKDFKQPICREKPVLTGEWVSINFQSDAASPSGERPLRKVLRYRDQTAAPLEDHVAHWESFAWDAGPVIVISKNLSWGTPQVWAASVAEGKRVLSHAAQVAGVDLTDPKHEWLISGSRDPRYGRTGRMRLDTRRGTFVRVTKRPGPSGLPSGFAPTP